MMMMTSPDKDLDGEPGVADALDIEEGVVGVGAVLVQRPVGDVTTSRRHCDVPGSFDIYIMMQCEKRKIITSSWESPVNTWTTLYNSR